jgi:hypothetical protein
MDECEKLFAELDTIHSEKDEYIVHVAKQLSSQTDYIKQLEKRILLLEGRLKDARLSFPAKKEISRADASYYDENRRRPNPLGRVITPQQASEERTRSLVKDYYKGSLSYSALIKSIEENPLRRAGII